MNDQNDKNEGQGAEPLDEKPQVTDAGPEETVNEAAPPTPEQEQMMADADAAASPDTPESAPAEEGTTEQSTAAAADAQPEPGPDPTEAPEGVTLITDFRASLVNSKYQAQVRCPECKSWVLTENLEAFHEGEGEETVLVAEASNVICKKQTVPPCGYELGTIRIAGWLHSSPIKWRGDEPFAD